MGENQPQTISVIIILFIFTIVFKFYVNYYVFIIIKYIYYISIIKIVN